MVDTGIFATSAEILQKAGAGVSTVSSAEAYTNSFQAQAESRINVETNYNWSDAYSGLNIDKKCILKEASSDLSATYVISYDMGSIGASEAKARIDVLITHYKDCIKVLIDANAKSFVQSA